MVKIRYADLPGGLHVRAVASGRDTIVYLLPGLTGTQRRDALRRARSSARVGHGPRLPAVGVASAVMADGIRSTVRNAAAAVRAHPAIFIPQFVIVVVAAVAYVLLVSVSGRVYSPQPDQTSFGGQGAAAAAPPGGRPMRPAVRVPSASRSAAPPDRSGGGRHPSGISPFPPPGPDRDPTPTPTPTPTTAPTPSPTPTSSPAPAPKPSPGQTPSSPPPTPVPFSTRSGLA